MSLSTSVDLVQLTPRRSFDLARALSEIGVLRSITSDCAFTSRSLSFLSSLSFLKKVRLDQYNLDPLKVKHLFVVYPAKLFLLIAGLFKPASLARLFFYLSAQSIVQLAFIATDIFRSPTKSINQIVFCFDTGAFLVIGYKLLFNKRFSVYIEQCVSPRLFQLDALHKYSSSKISFSTRAYFKLLSFIERFEYKHAKVIVCPSSIVYDQLINLGISSDRLRLIPYSFESNIDFSIKSERNPISKPKILFVGNDLMRKGVTTLLDSLELLQAYDYEVHLVGNFSLGDLKHVIQSPIPHQVFVHGKLNKDKLYVIYRSCNVFVSPSFCEGSPMTILEAASFGNLIIASLESGCNFKPFVEYLPFTAGNHNELASHLSNFMDNPDQFSDMISNCRIALERFSSQSYRTLLSESLS